ncbi:MAG: hypothetical protein HY927_05725 [Elusimicrobia bacterium]|nr:hypothetical protein [Elusimicrobiota bacterium]
MSLKTIAGRKSMVAGLALAALAPSIWAASVPNLMTYQGRLKESGSLVTGTRSVEIYLCDLPTGGSCYSASGPQNVSVISGIFKSTFSVAGVINLGNPPWYVDVRVGGTPLTPREQLTTTPYAFVSSTTLSIAAAGVQPGVLGTGIHFSSSVGIGTTAPEDLLEIATEDPSVSHVTLSGFGTNIMPSIHSRRSRGTKAAPTAVQLNDRLGGYGAFGYDGSAFQWAGKFGVKADGNASPGSMPGYIDFNTTPSGSVNPAERMRIDSNGNVGIGTTQPAYKLDVAGNMRVTGQLDAGVLGSGVTLAAGQLGSGVIGSGVYFPASQVQAGNFGSGVYLPASQVQAGTLGSGVVVSMSAGQLGSGLLGSGVYLPASQVQAGNFGSGVYLPASQVQAGTLGSGVLLPASQVGAGVLGTGVILSYAVRIATVSASITDAHPSGGANVDHDYVQNVGFAPRVVQCYMRAIGKDSSDVSCINEGLLVAYSDGTGWSFQSGGLSHFTTNLAGCTRSTTQLYVQANFSSNSLYSTVSLLNFTGTGFTIRVKHNTDGGWSSAYNGSGEANCVVFGY